MPDGAVLDRSVSRELTGYCDLGFSRPSLASVSWLSWLASSGSRDQARYRCNYGAAMPQVGFEPSAVPRLVRLAKLA